MEGEESTGVFTVLNEELDKLTNIVNLISMLIERHDKEILRLSSLIERRNDNYGH